MKNKNSTLIREEKKPEILEKVPIRWTIDKEKTRLINCGVEATIRYRPNIGTDRRVSSRSFKFTDEELEAIKIKNPDNNERYDKVALTRAIARNAQDKFRQEIDQKLLDCYHEKDLDATIALFEDSRELSYLLRGYAYYEAKMLKMRAF